MKLYLISATLFVPLYSLPQGNLEQLDGADANGLRGADQGIDQAQAACGDCQIVQGVNDNVQFRMAIPNGVDTATMGINVLLHGDGGQSFFEFPNAKQEVITSTNLMGVVMLAPNNDLRWGGVDNARTDGPDHVKRVANIISTVLPKMAKFDASKVFFTGVSGGSLTLTSAMIPLFGDKFPSGMMILCGALNNGAIPAKSLPKRVHFQTTQQELDQIQPNVPLTITAIEDAATQGGQSAAQINKAFTVNGDAQGGHCEFDGQDFNTGIQLAVDNFAAIMLGKGAVDPQIGEPKGIIGNEDPFAAGIAGAGGAGQAQLEQAAQQDQVGESTDDQGEEEDQGDETEE